MKYYEFHQKVKKAGWKHVNTRGDLRIYEKNGEKYPIPFHDSGSIAPKALKRLKKLFKVK